MIDAPHVKLRSSRVVRWPLRCRGGRCSRRVIFAVDLTTTAGFGISALYVIPLLLGTLTGPPRVAYIGGAIASALVGARRPSRLPLVATVLVRPGESRRSRSPSSGRRSCHRPIARGVAPPRGAHPRSGGRELRARKVGDRRGHRRARRHHVRQRQVLRDLEVLAGGAARPGSPDPQLRLSPEGVHPRTVDDDRQRPHLARRDPQSRQGRIALLGRHDDRAVPERAPASRISTWRSATTSPIARQSEKRLREQAALARLGEMAAVVAHEVKNPIAGIRGALQVISSRMPAGDARSRGHGRHHRPPRRAQRRRAGSAGLRATARVAHRAGRPRRR